MTPTLRGALNTTATQVKPCEPWSFVPKIPEELIGDKKAFAKWRSMPSTDYLVFTATEGVNPNIRVSKNNPVRRLHGLIADFDAHINAEACLTVLDRCPADLRPTWLSRTFSGGARLVWMFAEPLPLEIGDLAKEFLKVAWNELKIQKLFAGADQPAFLDLTKLYDVGRGWEKISDAALPSNVLHYWLFEATKKARFSNLKEIEIPIEAVAEEVERQFPGRWEGPFEVGARGVVFFDPASTNPTAAIVTEAGMICFSQDQLFHPWSKIFGGSFVRQFQTDKIGAAVKNVWYDGKAYYLKSSYGVWEPHNKDDFIAKLKVKHAIDAAKDRGAVASEMDMALVHVQENRRVTGVIPKVYDPQELLYFNGRRFLNCAAVQAMTPADTKQEWAVNFPWLANFFDTCWDVAPVPCVDPKKPDMDAKTVFLAWWKRFYASALAGELLKGQALFIAGEVSKGKTLLSTQIISRSVGGFSDASEFLNSSTNFNKELLEVGMWCIDDAVVIQDRQAHQKFSEMVKRAVANPFFSYHAKYRDAQRVAWHGRVVVTLNDDASSIRIIPNLEASIEEKIIVLKFSDASREFPDWSELDDIITSELPFFLRWLLDWTPPPAVMGEKRFGVNAYIHEELRVKSLHAGGVSDLLECIEVWIKRTNPMEKHGKTWRGSASEWLTEVNQEDAMRPLIAKFTPATLGKKFVEATRIRGSRISVVTGSDHHGNYYEIHLNGQEPERKTVKVTPTVEG